MISKRNTLIILTAVLCQLSLSGDGGLYARPPLSPARSVRPASMPIGIPAPQFGITESHRMYARPDCTYKYGSDPEPYRTADSGPYTHYVDRAHRGATDSNNPFGTPNRPRRTVPVGPLPPGSVVEIHGGGYGDQVFHGEGTAGRPVFFRGPSFDVKAEFRNQIAIRGQYLIVENIYLQGHHVQIKVRATDTGAPHHVGIRRCEIAGDGRFDTDGGQAISIRGNSAHKTHNIVIYDNHIHHHGDSRANTSQDRHGIAVTSYTSDIWILNNDIHHSQGDSVQIRGGTQGDGTNNHLVRRIYVGRNVLHEDRENAVDIKQCSDVIISQNEMYGYMRNTGDGDAVTIHYGPSRVWLLFNRIHNCRRGIADSNSKGLYIIGNVFYDIESWAVNLWGKYAKHVINNTIYRCGGGIAYEFSGYPCHMINNIIADMTAAGRHVFVEKPASCHVSEMHHNLLYQPDGEIVIEWPKGKRYNDVGWFNSASRKGEGCIRSDPKFRNPGMLDLRLLSESKAINAGASIQGYVDLYTQLYGLDVSVDFSGVARPQDQVNDIGAFEFVTDSESANGGGL